MRRIALVMTLAGTALLVAVILYSSSVLSRPARRLTIVYGEWRMHILRDGRAALTVGEGANGTLPKGSFDIVQIAKELQLRDTNANSSGVRVAIERDSGEVETFECEDEAVVQEILNSAVHEADAYDKEALLRAWRATTRPE